MRKMKLTLPSAIVILSVCILFSANNIANAIREASFNSGDSGTYYYELSRFNENFEKLIEVLKNTSKEGQ